VLPFFLLSQRLVACFTATGEYEIFLTLYLKSSDASYVCVPPS